MNYIEVIELGKKKLIPRNKFNEYCEDRMSWGMQIIWPNPEKFGKVRVEFPKSAKIKPWQTRKWCEAVRKGI